MRRGDLYCLRKRKKRVDSVTENRYNKEKEHRQEVVSMELAKVTAKGQITIPIGVRKKLGIKEGSKVIFLEEAGRIYLANSSMEALQEAQLAFAGEAERVGWKTEEDVVSMIRELREERMVK